MATKKYHFETLQLHVGQEQPDPTTDARAVPIYQTTSYVFRNSQHAADRFGLRDAGNIYGRLTNPTQGVFEDRVAALEGGVAGLAVASGAAAVTYALQNILSQGDHIVAADNLYGGSFNLITHTLATQGITNTIVNVNNLEALEAAIQPSTKVVYAETFGNPNSDVTDIEAIAEVAHRHNIPLIVDNTFGTPYLFRPIEHGADIVVHSATKFIGGHGTSLGGVIVDGGTFDWKANADKFPTLAKPDPSYHGAIFADVAGKAAFVTRIRAVILRDTGATISPFNAFILLQGLETLSLRVERHVENALKVVDYLSKHPKVAKVNHPSLPGHPDHALYQKYFPNGGGSIFTIEIKGGEKEAWKFIDSLEIFSLLANVADVKSLVIHPYTTTHSQMTPEELAQQHITPSTVRLSIGIEHIDDIIDVVVLTSNRGLAGGYNSNIVKLITHGDFKKEELDIYAVGAKGEELLTSKGYHIVESAPEMMEDPTYEDAAALCKRVLKAFTDGQVGEIYLAYTHFKNTVTQEAKLIKLLPVELDESGDNEKEDSNILMNFEPNPEEALELIIPKYVTSLFYGALVESFASENGARMQAMDSATSNAEDMISDLTLKYNRARQGSITQELTEIIAGANAIE